jgi:hypothetical protein
MQHMLWFWNCIKEGKKNRYFGCWSTSMWTFDSSVGPSKDNRKPVKCCSVRKLIKSDLSVFKYYEKTLFWEGLSSILELLSLDEKITPPHYLFSDWSSFRIQNLKLIGCQMANMIQEINFSSFFVCWRKSIILYWWF